MLGEFVRESVGEATTAAAPDSWERHHEGHHERHPPFALLGAAQYAKNAPEDAKEEPSEGAIATYPLKEHRAVKELRPVNRAVKEHRAVKARLKQFEITFEGQHGRKPRARSEWGEMWPEYERYALLRAAAMRPAMLKPTRQVTNPTNVR